jgi:hypothetical protein
MSRYSDKLEGYVSNHSWWRVREMASFASSTLQPMVIKNVVCLLKHLLGVFLFFIFREDS